MSQLSVRSMIEQCLNSGKGVLFFLDYDGTLVPIAQTPQQVPPDAPLLELLSYLASMPQIRAVILSGRPLATLRELLPVSNIILAGNYGLEIQMPGGGVITRVHAASLRPTLERVKSNWGQLVGDKNGFLIEDKGLAVALHAQFASLANVDSVLLQARKSAEQIMNPRQFRILDGNRFLELASSSAHKGGAVKWLMDRPEFKDILPVYLGDDDKDAEAFESIHQRGGFALLVGKTRGTTNANELLSSPTEVHQWLRELWRRE